ncbi:MAG: hypothetical protein KIH69_008285 [Anaerolineae bacterium]|nr:hypothetical protein [Anaerolineae bacterium]
MQISGSYSYSRNGVATGIREKWSLKIGIGGMLFRTERDASIFGSHIAVEARGFDLAHLFWFRVDWRNTNPDAVKTASAIYDIGPDTIHVKREVDGTMTHEIIPRPERLVVSPLMRIFYGGVLLQLEAAQEVCPVLVPWIHQPNNAQMLLSAQLDPRRARLLDKGKIKVAGETHVVKRYEYIGGNYTADSQFWVNDAGILVRYTFAQSQNDLWEVQMTYDE